MRTGFHYIGYTASDQTTRHTTITNWTKIREDTFGFFQGGMRANYDITQYISDFRFNSMVTLQLLEVPDRQNTSEMNFSYHVCYQFGENFS